MGVCFGCVCRLGVTDECSQAMTKMRLQESQNFCEALEHKLRDADLRNQSLDQKFQVLLLSCNLPVQLNCHKLDVTRSVHSRMHASLAYDTSDISQLCFMRQSLKILLHTTITCVVANPVISK
jgi:hypothetical protein